MGILAAIAIPRFTKQTANAQLVADKASASNSFDTKTGDEIITALKELDLLDDVGKPQSGGEKFIVGIATTDVDDVVVKGGITVGITGDLTKFYPVKNN